MDKMNKLEANTWFNFRQSRRSSAMAHLLDSKGCNSRFSLGDQNPKRALPIAGFYEPFHWGWGVQCFSWPQGRVEIISTLGMVAKNLCFLQTPSKHEQNQKTKKPNNMPRTVKKQYARPSHIAPERPRKGVDCASSLGSAEPVLLAKLNTHTHTHGQDDLGNVKSNGETKRLLC